MLTKIKAALLIARSAFLSGLFTIIPIAATLFFINFLYVLISNMLVPLERVEPVWLYEIPGSEFVLVTLIILLIGFIVRTFIVDRAVQHFEKVVNHIPLVRIVYSAAKILVDFFKASDATQAMQRRVVLIPYPKKGQYHLAFLLESAEDNYERIIPDTAKHYAGERYVKVFMPNSPNPTSGYFFIMPEDEIILTDISFEEAVKSLVSCGLITPESLLKKP